MNRKERRQQQSIASKLAPADARPEPQRIRARTRDAMPALGSNPKEPPATSRSLFHYTNAAGLIGIVKTQTIFATHANFLNDSAECKILRDVLKPQFEKEIAEVTPDLIKAKLLSPDVYKEHGEKVHAMQADKLLDAMITAIENISPFYISSFCIHAKDSREYGNGLLSQWRGYANGGFAIEFDELEIDRLAKLERESFRYQGILTNVISYSDHDKIAKPESFAGLAREMVYELFKRTPSDGNSANQRFEKYHKPFLETLPFLKDRGFSEEQEYRLAALCNRPNMTADTDNRSVRATQFRESASGAIVPYIRVFEGLGEKLPIRGVLVGPHANQDNQTTALRLLLDQENIQAEVRQSKLTFRRT